MDVLLLGAGCASSGPPAARPQEVPAPPDPTPLYRELDAIENTFGEGLTLLVDGEVDAAAETQAVVDAYDLLVMRGIDRMLPIEAEVDAWVILPFRAGEQRQRLARRVQGGDAPYQDADLEGGMSLHEPAQQVLQRRRSLAGAAS